MRRGTMALTLVVGLGVVGIVSADESGNWFSRMFAFSGEKTDKKDLARLTAELDAPKMPPTAATSRAKRARADWERRLEACDRLRGIALAVGDEEMLQKVEQLEQRAWDVYAAAANIRNTPNVGEVKKGDR